MCRSGMTSRCVCACGLMSRMATSRRSRRRGRPRGRACRRGSRAQAARMPSSVTRRAANADECADRCIDEPRRIVVAVAATRAVDEHNVISADLRAPAREAGFVRRSAETRAAFLLLRGRNRVSALGHRARPRRVREHVDLRQAGAPRGAQRVGERALVLVGEADDDVARQVELVRERRKATEVCRRGVAAAHRAEHVVVARLQRHVEVAGDGRRLAQRGDQRLVHMVDLNRRESQALESRRRPDGADEAGEIDTPLAVAVAPEVDAGEDDLAVALGDAAFDLSEHVLGAAAA